ncbi:MAG: DsbA family protein [Gammaproteobacteria bacterium]|nr:DsbA family protein [Gammaproteobacteria bacterium]
MKYIPIATEQTGIFHPSPAHRASRVGNQGVEAVSTTALISFFETVSNDLASPDFGPDEISVGAHVSVDHLAPARGDESVAITAILEKQQGKRLEFDLIAMQGETLVMRGKHHRAVRHRERFSDASKTIGKVADGMDFWFDFHSPWCYLVSHRIGGIARQFNMQVNWKPVHLANLIQAVDGRRPLESNSRFLAWYLQDLQDAAALQGLPYCPHHDYPKRPSRALRAAMYAQDRGLAEPFVRAIMKGYWSGQQDISDLDWLKLVADSVGLGGDELAGAALADEYKNRLNQNLTHAVKQNLFGLPAMVAGGKIFLGNDRLDLLRHFLSARPPHLGVQNGPRPGRSAV